MIKKLQGYFFPLVAIVFSLMYIHTSLRLPTQDILMIRPVAIILVCLCFTQIFFSFKKGRVSSVSEVSEKNSPPKSFRQHSKVFIFAFECLLYIIALQPVGFLFATPLFIGLSSFLLGTRNWKVLVGVSLVVTFSIYGIFEILLQVPLPHSTLFF